jgi:NADPH-dependent glutamate synthase beta subunit-like oxidoreductase
MAILHEKVPFPFVLGHICNHKCELGCKRNGLNEPVAIRNLKRFAAVNATNEKWMEKTTFKARTGKKVAIVGGGPCGLTAAYYLNKQGHDVDVFEKRPQLGGPMTSGIPSYRLPIEGVNKEIQIILDSGVRAECNTEISDVRSLKERYDAVLVSVGVSHGKKLMIPGSDYEQVYTAIDVLADLRQGNDISRLGQKVTVIGAGSVGYDVARSLVRKGLQVNIACIEQPDKILADKEDQEEAADEGVVLFAGRSFEEIEGGEKGVTGLRVHTVLSSTYDRATGTVTEVAKEGSRMVIPCDSVIFATGQHTGLSAFEDFGIEINRFGYPVTDGFRTSGEGIFAAGDAVTGISFVINAIAQGRDAAAEIDTYLGGSGQIDEKLCDRKADPVIGTMEGFAELPRTEQILRGAERAQDENDVYLTYTPEQARNEAERCLQCDLRNDIGHVCPWMDYTTK